MDDINPDQPFLLSATYCHNAWEAFAELGKRTNLEMHAILPSYAGYVRRGNQIGHKLDVQPTYEFLDANREELTRPLSWQQIMETFQ